MDDHVQAARSQRVHTALGEVTGEEAHVNGVVELMLDITESSVAFCWELGAGKLHAGKTYAQHAPLSYCMYQSRHDCCHIAILTTTFTVVTDVVATVAILVITFCPCYSHVC